MTASRFPDAPPAIQKLSVDARGYPIPWFVYVDDQGKEDFRVIGPGKVGRAVRQQLCWICGRPLHRTKTFVIGPMCAINRISAEPPSHVDCALFAAQSCPFLSQPLAKRNDRNLPIAHIDGPGIPIARNPGVTLVWLCDRFKLVHVDNGVLFEIGAPRRVLWYARGRPATREEVMESIDSGFPILFESAQQDGPDALAELNRRYRVAMNLLPKAA